MNHEKTAKDGSVAIEIYSDKMSAVAFVMPPDKGGRSVNMDDLKRAMEEAGVVRGIIEDAKILKQLNEAEEMPVSFIAARGVAPGPRVDGMVHCLWQNAESSKKSGGSTAILSVKVGDVIAKKTLPQKGSDGFTITGEVFTGEDGKPSEAAAGDNVRLSEDGLEFIALAAGAPKFIGGVVSVDPVYVIQGDVCESSGNVKFVGALEIRGAIKDGFMVEAGGNIMVLMSVGASEVISGGSVTVQGEIKTGKDGKVVAEGNVYAAKIVDSVVEAGRDVISDDGILESKVWCNGKVYSMGDKEGIVGGDVSGYMGVYATSVGDEKKRKTIVRAGARKEFYTMRADLEGKLERVAIAIKNTRQEISAAGQAGKSGQSKENLAKLEFAKTKLEEKLKEISKMERVSLDVNVEGKKIIHAGCTIFIGGRSVKIDKTLGNVVVREGSKKGIEVSSFDQDKKEIVTKSFLTF